MQDVAGVEPGHVVVDVGVDEAKAVSISMAAFEAYIDVSDRDHQPSGPVEQLRREFGVALAEAGYATPDQVVVLVSEVKQELAEVRATAR